MFKYFSIALLCTSQAAFAATQCFIVKNLEEDSILKMQGNCEERVSPASTFKIPLSLMGFDIGILYASLDLL